MAVFELNKPVETADPVIRAERLDPGFHVFELKVVDEAGNVSLPVKAQVTVRTSGPRVTSFEPEFGRAGTKVILRASGIDPDLQKNQIMFGGIPADVTGGSSRTLHTVVPKEARTGDVTLANKFGQGVSDLPFIIPESFDISGFKNPAALCFIPESRLAAVADEHPESSKLGRISIIDLGKRAVINTFTVEFPVHGLTAYSPEESAMAAVWSSSEPRMAFLHPEKEAVSATLALPMPTRCAAAVPGGKQIYAVLSREPGGQGQLAIINTGRFAVEQTLKLETGPHAIAVNPVSGIAYVTNAGSGTITLVDTRKGEIIKTLPAGPGASVIPVGISAASDSASAWCIHAAGSASLFFEDSRTGDVKIGVPPVSISSLPGGGTAFAAGSPGKFLMALQQDRGKISALALNISYPSDGRVPSTTSPDGKGVMVLHPNVRAASFFDARTLRCNLTLPLSGTPEICDASPEGNFFAALCAKEGLAVFVGAESVVIR